MLNTPNVLGKRTLKTEWRHHRVSHLNEHARTPHSPGDDVNLLGPELEVVDPLEDDVAPLWHRVRQLVVEQRVRGGHHRGALDPAHQRILHGAKNHNNLGKYLIQNNTTEFPLLTQQMSYRSRGSLCRTNI